MILCRKSLFCILPSSCPKAIYNWKVLFMIQSSMENSDSSNLSCDFQGHTMQAVFSTDSDVSCSCFKMLLVISQERNGKNA